MKGLYSFLFCSGSKDRPDPAGIGSSGRWAGMKETSWKWQIIAAGRRIWNFFKGNGTKLEYFFKKIVEGAREMKRNKRTIIMAHEELTPLTEHVLAQMGKEGNAIRRRLKSFYRERGLDNQPPLEAPLEGQILEVA